MVLQCRYCAIVSGDVQNRNDKKVRDRKDFRKMCGRDPVCTACYKHRNRIATERRKLHNKLQIGDVPTTKTACSYDLHTKPINFSRHSEFQAAGTLVSIKKPATPQDIHDEDLRIQAAAILHMFSRQAYTRSYLPK